ncbi:MAG: helix-turn-helix transcriptional regulator [Actinobacteria bacterium]|uniref:HTH cro/C1-type domain-containing protein n=1 Tax=Nostocoides veronense TaxID=330836 RepID=A0ABP4XMJ4_9MICO|nr:helix-turn-helix transcriptional regulator [Actinomycetota bacterium]
MTPANHHVEHEATAGSTMSSTTTTAVQHMLGTLQVGIQRAADQKGMTLGEVEQRAGLAPGALSDPERLPVDDLAVAARVLGTTASALVKLAETAATRAQPRPDAPWADSVHPYGPPLSDRWGAVAQKSYPLSGSNRVVAVEVDYERRPDGSWVIGGEHACSSARPVVSIFRATTGEEGDLTPEQARELAAVLVEAAEFAARIEGGVAS